MIKGFHTQNSASSNSAGILAVAIAIRLVPAGICKDVEHLCTGADLGLQAALVYCGVLSSTPIVTINIIEWRMYLQRHIEHLCTWDSCWTAHMYRDDCSHVQGHWCIVASSGFLN